MVERIVDALGTGPADLVLDAGCGLGGPARRLIRLVGCRVVGLDVLPAVVAAARERSRGEVRAPAFAAGSAEALPFRARVFDQAWSLGMVAHVPDASALVREILRVLRPGGKLAITEAFWEGDAEPRFARVAPQPWTALRADDLASDLRGAGGADVRIVPWPGGGFTSESEVGDADLRADLMAGRLVSRMILARAA
jgi:SAM-dependent methyltransferase